MAEVISLARVIRPSGAVHFAGARAEVEADSGNAASSKGPIRLEAVVAPRTAFEPVQHEHEGSLRVRIGGEVEVEKVAVGEFPSFAAQEWLLTAAQGATDEGLHVGMGKAWRGAKARRMCVGWKGCGSHTETIANSGGCGETLALGSTYRLNRQERLVRWG